MVYRDLRLGREETLIGLASDGRERTWCYQNASLETPFSSIALTLFLSVR
jgi:hypothetical protein